MGYFLKNINARRLLEKYWAVIVVVALCFFAIRSLLVPGYFTMHDDEQIARLYELHRAFVNGQIPPRWVPDLGFGFGYPLFNFYPPLVYYIGEIFYLMGFSLISATKIVMALGFILSAIFMYLWVKRRFGTSAGILAAVLYTYAPYHAVDLYVRGALSEFFSFVWIPLVFWSYDELFEKKTIGWGILAGIFLSFVILTHNLTAIAFFPFLALYLLYLFYERKKSFKKIIPYVFLSGIIAIGLSAYFWLPSLLEKQYTLVDKILTGELADYRLYFVYLQQFWNSPWGYGGAVPGPRDALSFQVGKIHLILSVLALIIFFTMLFTKKQSRTYFPLVMGALLFLSLFMATDYSRFVWGSFHSLAYIQFPWRFLLLTAVFTSALGGIVAFQLQKYRGDLIAKLFVIIVCAVTVFKASQYFHPQKYLPISDDYYTKNNGITWYVSSLSYEYVPQGVATRLSNVKTTKLAIDQSDIPQKSYQIISGDMTVSEVLNKPQIKEYVVTATTLGMLQINTFSFPGWEVLIDGQKSAYLDNNRLKLITIAVPKGEHTIVVSFNNTPPRTIGNVVTALTLFFTCLYPINTIMKRKYMIHDKR